MLYDFKTQKWTNWINEPGAIGFSTWSKDGKYVYYDNTSTKKSAFLRAKVGHTRPEFLIDLKDMRRYGKYGWAWGGLAPDDAPLLARDASSDEVYSLDLELRFAAIAPVSLPPPCAFVLAGFVASDKHTPSPARLAKQLSFASQPDKAF